MLALTYCMSLLGEAPESQDPGNSGLCRRYVVSVFALGRLFFTQERLSHVCWAFFYSRSTFFRVLGGSGSDVWASRDNFEGPKLLFLVFCRPRRSAMRTNCACAKTTIFPVFLYGFYILRALSPSHKTTQNQGRGLFNRASGKDCAPIPS